MIKSTIKFCLYTLMYMTKVWITGAIIIYFITKTIDTICNYVTTR